MSLSPSFPPSLSLSLTPLSLLCFPSCPQANDEKMLRRGAAEGRKERERRLRETGKGESDKTKRLGERESEREGDGGVRRQTQIIRAKCVAEDVRNDSLIGTFVSIMQHPLDAISALVASLKDTIGLVLNSFHLFTPPFQCVFTSPDSRLDSPRG